MRTLLSHSPFRGLALLLLLGATAVAQTTVTALSAGPRTPFPNATDNSFESTVGSGQAVQGSWASWVMTGTSGIAHQTHAWVAPLLAPGGRRVAYLQGTSSIAATPAIAAVAPGNWRVRFRGAQRTDVASHQVVQVMIDSVLVFEGELQSLAFQEYTTRTVHIATPPPPMTVTIQGTSTNPSDVGLVDLVELEPVADWNAASSWSSAQVPGPTDPVLIPIDVEVAIRGAATADSVLVKGELVTAFEDATLDTHWVAVSGSTARFEVGQERTPFAQSFTLTLLGAVPADHFPNAGTKFLMAMDGATIDMHGTHKTSWTKLTSLAAVATPSSTDIQVLDHQGWKVGDELVVAFTGHVSHVAGFPACGSVYDGPRSRRGTITAIDPVTGVLRIDVVLPAAEHCTAAPLHYGPPFPLGWDLDQRAEVGMLTRNVRIVGSQAAYGFGGHVMIMACCTMMPPGLGRFSDIELSNMGQKQILGRYPLHWHMVRNERPGQYVRDSSIHDSNNRAITVHGSHRVSVENNVCFDTIGHAVFLEDGVERDNVIVHNLVLATRKPRACEQMLPHDNSRDEAQNRSPASFWISNPSNFFVGNVAADSLGTGYWFAIHVYPTGRSSTTEWRGFFDFAGLNADLGTFSGNAAHSLKMGIDVHDTVLDGIGTGTPGAACGSTAPCPLPVSPPSLDNPRDDDIQPNAQWRPVHEAVLSGFTAWGCTSGIYTGGGIEFPTLVRFDDCVLADNGLQVQFASSDTISNSVLVYDSGNFIFPTGFNGLSNGHLHPFERGNAYVVYDGPGQVDHCHLVGYDTSGRGNLVYSQFGAARRHTNHRFEGLTFAGPGIPAVKFHNFAAEPPTSDFGQPSVWGIAIRDIDGCLTGGSIPANTASPFWPGPTPHTLVTNHPMMHLVNGAATPDLQSPYLAATSEAWLSPFVWAHLQVRYFAPFGTVIPATGLCPDYLLHDGMNVPPVQFKRLTHQTWPSASFLSSVLPSAQMRQLPVIVKPAGTTAAECNYEIQLQDAPSLQTRRADLSIDDANTGDVTRLLITHASLPNWTPQLRINDNPLYLQGNGDNPNNLQPMVPSPPGATTTYQLTTIGGATAIDLRMVNPQRTHRITITW